MMSEQPTLKPECAAAFAALERDPLELPAEVERHLRICPPCAEAQVLLLALAEAPEVAVPQGYFQGLGFRIMRKLPGRRAGMSARAGYWLAAAGLLAALGLGATGFFMGRAAQPPMVEAAQPKGQADSLDQPLETPFTETEDPATRLTDLDPKDAERALQTLKVPAPAKPRK
jgi:hypothetical protein